MKHRGKLIACSLALVSQACAHHPLRVLEPNPFGDYHRERSNAFLWGAVEETRYARKCTTNVLDEVRTETSVPQALATILTLGIWMPSTVYYKCGKRPILPDEEPEAPEGEPGQEP